MSIRLLARRGLLLAMLAMVVPGRLLAQDAVKENCNGEAWDYFKASVTMVGTLSLFAATITVAPLNFVALGVAMEATGNWAEELDDYMDCRVEVENIDPNP